MTGSELLKYQIQKLRIFEQDLHDKLIRALIEERREKANHPVMALIPDLK